MSEVVRKKVKYRYCPHRIGIAGVYSGCRIGLDVTKCDTCEYNKEYESEVSYVSYEG